MYHQPVSQDGADIFSKVTAEERMRLFRDLANVRGEVTCKGDSDEVYRLIVERATAKAELQCSIPFGLQSPAKETELLGNFFLGGERYFFKTPVKVDQDVVVLRMDSDLFHLQRRQNYRIKIPENYQATLLISSLNKAPVKLTGQLYDLSSGGCRVVLTASTPVLEHGDIIEGHVVIGKRESLEIEGTVRHHKIEKGANVTKQIFGIEFKPLSSLLEGKLFAITMDLHREFFSRLNTKG
ncbi:MAG: PilZ domain-containing protein [Bdellovibrionales bacterium]|nr:PilZ domain-containing protein [Bdellovibrionales bacterium]